MRFWMALALVACGATPKPPPPPPPPPHVVAVDAAPPPPPDAPESVHVEPGVVGMLVDGKRHGVWIEAYADGSLRQIESFANDERDGIAVYFGEDGREVALGSYRNGASDGTWILHDEKGHLHVEGYDRGRREGPYLLFDEHGLVSAGSYHDDREIGRWRRWDRGRLDWDRVFLDGKLEGEARSFGYRGERESDTYIHGRRFGAHRAYDEHDKLVGEAFYIDDALHGHFKERDVEGNYDHGLKVGPWVDREYSVLLRGNYIAGLREGEWIMVIGKKPRYAITYVHGKKTANREIK